MGAEVRHEDGIAYREALPDGWTGAGRTALLLHGWPESSYMWRHLMPRLAAAGIRAIAPDFAGYGDSPADPPGTWEHHIETLERFRRLLAVEQVDLVVHDWGVLIGLRWACDHPGIAASIVISDGGFFPDRRWHDLANVLRTPGDGEALIESFTREQFDGALRNVSSGMTDDALEEYWKAFTDAERRRGTLELYRSGDFEKLERYEGCVAALGLPALIVWGQEDRFSTAALAERFHAELPGSDLLVLDGAGHFVWEDEPEATGTATVEFLRLL